MEGGLSGVEALLRFDGEEQDIEKVRIGFGDGGGCQVRRDAERQHPDLVQAESEGADSGPENERDRARETREQHRLDQRAMKRHFVPLRPAHMRRPPEYPRNPMPQETALNATARPKTTQSALRIIEPPSEKAIPTPKPTIATAPMTRETGPVSESS